MEVEIGYQGCCADMIADTGQHTAFGVAFALAGHGPVHADTGPVDLAGSADFGQQFVYELIEIGLDD